MFWFMLGPMFLLLIAVGIVNSGTGWLTRLDALYAGVVALTLVCRWLDQRSRSITKNEGQPSTTEDFRRYVGSMLLAAAVGWIVANVAGNHILN
jgi:hypothetical protein